MAESKEAPKRRVLTPREVQSELYQRVKRKPWQGMTFRPVRRSDRQAEEQRQQDNNQNSKS